MAGDPKFEGSQNVPEFGYAAYAELLGLKGIRVDRPESIGAAWELALSADRPCVAEFICDPEVPPLPPHITVEQAKHFMTSLLRDPSRTAMLKDSMKQMLGGILK